MGENSPVIFKDPDKLVDFIIEKVGKKLVLGMQLGLGKPNNIANAVYRRAVADPTISLKIVTALSLEPPVWGNDLERRMLEPIVDRIWKGYVPLDYARAVREQTLPPNVEVSEFFYKAGAFMNNDHMQQNYISVNYTHAARDVTAVGMNVAGALIGQKELDGQLKYSVGCNGDTAMDALDLMRKDCEAKGRAGIAVGELNTQLPFMYGDAVLDPSEFDAILDNSEIETTLFGVPKEAINTTDYMIGMHASSIIKDDGTLQIGIGSLGDAIAYGLDLRHHNNDIYQAVLKESGHLENAADLIREWGGLEPFEKGLYGATEMFVDAFLHLYQRDIMRRRCYDNEAIQEVVSSGIGEDGKVTPEFMIALLKNGRIHPRLTQKDFNMLVDYGVFEEGLTYESGMIKQGDASYSADFTNRDNLNAVIENCLGTKLKKGYWIHAGFYVGPPSFYETMNAMNDAERMEINMTSVLNVNQLYGNNAYASEALKLMQRKNGRFINAGLMATLGGAIVSDGLENGKVISGVGGQYNFVSLAHAMDDARGGIMIRSTRGSGKKLVSNIVFSYGHTTVPRHLRDLVITEYGIADIRSKSDKEIIKAMLNIADSRFQDQLLSRAKKARKIEQDYVIPDRFRNNTPQRLEAILKPMREKGFFQAFPFGTDFTDQEIQIGKALRGFKSAMAEKKFSTLKQVGGRLFKPVPEAAVAYLERLQLDNPGSLKEKLLQKVVIEALSAAKVI